MKIYGNGSGPIRPDRSKDIQHKTSDAPPRALPVSRTPERNDRVDISPAGRARSERMHALPMDAADRLHSIRERVLSGAYDADAVVAEVARRIIDRGDV